MNKKRKILAISGSTRTNSSNEIILIKLKEVYKENIEFNLFLDIDKLPHFNPDLDTNSPPREIEDLRNKIGQADGILFCTPEYVFSLPGTLKNLIDWTVSTSVFSKKPTAFIVASASGEKVYENLDLILNTLECSLQKQSKVLIKGIKGKINKETKEIEKSTLERLKIAVESLINDIG